MLEESDSRQVKFYIDYQTLEIENYDRIESVKIYDIDGTLVCNSFIDNNDIAIPFKSDILQKKRIISKKYYYHVDLSSLPIGSYIVSATDEKGNKQTKKFIYFYNQ